MPQHKAGSRYESARFYGEEDIGGPLKVARDLIHACIQPTFSAGG
jgi:hypothetical protein